MRSAGTLNRAWPLKTLMLLVIAVLLPTAAEAFPSFARQVGRDCTYCHTAFPKLNDTGRAFLFNGYRFEAEGEWKAVKDLQSAPVSFEVEVEGLYDKIKTAGVRTEASDLKVEEAEVIAAGAFGREGRVTALFSAAVQQSNDGSFDTVVPKAFVQINDLLGPTGAGMLNIKAGIDSIGLPFFRPTSTPITNASFAETLIGVLGTDQRFIELNGSVTSEGDRTVAHRYRAGIARERVESGNKLKGFYASWAATLDEALSFGAIFRAGSESTAGQDNSYQRYGVAAEAATGPFIFTAGYFKSQTEGAAHGDDWLVEALYFVKKLTLGARYEAASFEGAKTARSQILMARYGILSNAFVQLEYRRRQDEDRIAGGGEIEDKGRVILVTLF